MSYHLPVELNIFSINCSKVWIGHIDGPDFNCCLISTGMGMLKINPKHLQIWKHMMNWLLLLGIFGLRS